MAGNRRLKMDELSVPHSRPPSCQQSWLGDLWRPQEKALFSSYGDLSLQTLLLNLPLQNITSVEILPKGTRNFGMTSNPREAFRVL